jgi:N-carbamoyl-L-amino-acid hydrolase
VDGQRLNGTLDELSRYGALAGGGADRPAWSDAYLEARSYVTGLMESAGLDVHVDVAGNLSGRLAGRDPGRRPLLLGSHIDTVPHGGNYDGCVGAMAAVELATVLHSRDSRLRHPLEVVIWADEEGGIIGSRAFVGLLPATDLQRMQRGPASLAELITRLGGRPQLIQQNVRGPGSIAGYIELHVEQGGILDSLGLDIGIVEGIVGVRQHIVTLTGSANHAGSTPMDQRHDALLAASEVVQGVNQIVNAPGGSHVGTVGRMEIEPNVPNVIPGKARLTIEIRDLSATTLDRTWGQVELLIEDVAERRGVSVRIEAGARGEPALSDDRIMELCGEAATRLGLSQRRMPSGAGHDAQALASIGPMGMIFVPSEGGISHSPQELTRPQEITNGANVLLQAVLAFDQEAPA